MPHLFPGEAGAKAYARLATGMVEHGNVTEAEEALRKAVEEDPSLPEVHNSLGLCMLMRGEASLAKRNSKKR